LKINFYHFFGGGLKNLKVPMPRPKMKNFKKNFKNLFFDFFPTQSHKDILGKLKINFYHFFGGGLKKT